MKIIVTHISPDLDAICSAWLLKKFLPGWNEARIEFVPSGSTFNDKPVDSDINILHADTGLGILDHHQKDENVCAATKAFDYVLQKNPDLAKKETEMAALKRLTVIINEIDHFGEVYWPEADNDRYEFFLDRIFDGWELKYPDQSRRVMEWGLDNIDGLYQVMLSKVSAEKELAKGIEFTSPWGKAIALETINDEVIKLSQRKGYKLAVRKDPRKGYLRIKTLPSTDFDLTDIYRKLKKKDPEATWYLHVSKNMLLNGSTHNPEMRSTKLTLKEIIEIIKKG